MKISTKAKYGFRFMIHLARNFNVGLVQVKDVAEKENISCKYLEQIAYSFKISGLVKVVRGAKGGYALSRDPENITLLDIMRATDGEINLTDCVASPEMCTISDVCIMNPVWSDLNRVISNYLSDKTLKSLIT